MNNPHRDYSAASSRRKLADLTTATGAGILGAGLALLVGALLRPFAVPLLLIGALLHSWGMYDRHRLERQAAAVEPRWATALYWICWVSLLALGAYIIAEL